MNVIPTKYVGMFLAPTTVSVQRDMKEVAFFVKVYTMPYGFVYLEIIFVD